MSMCVCLYKEKLWMDLLSTITSVCLEEWDSGNKKENTKNSAMNFYMTRIFIIN